MINCAIYPRKSKADDRSDSMQTQIEMCRKYIEDKYGKDNCNIFIYDGDYGISGYHTRNRFDFLRMMDDVKAGKINLVVIQRFDRIARNTRDFCNLYHDIEVAGCNLVSVSQQIDTTTPYGKNFMYMQASMAELEWALTSERRKDANRYAVSIGKCNMSMKQLPLGYTAAKVEGMRRMVIDQETEPMVRKIFSLYSESYNGNEVARRINDEYGTNLTSTSITKMIKNPFYHGEYKNNKSFCEPYLTEEEQLLLNRKHTSIKRAPNMHNVSLFSGMIKCPGCGRVLNSAGYQNGKNYLRYYKCRYHVTHQCSFTRSKSQLKIEKHLVENIDTYMQRTIRILEQQNNTNDNEKKMESINKEIDRLNNMYQKGRISEDKYDAEYLRLSDELAKYKAQNEPRTLSKKIIDTFTENWEEMYYGLDSIHKKRFWRDVIKEIVVDSDLNIIDIIFM